MKSKLLSFLAETIFAIVLWAGFIAFAVCWPLTFLYLRFVSKMPVSDLVSYVAEQVILVNNILDRMTGWKGGE